MNDAVTDGGSYWLALVATGPGTSNSCEPSYPPGPCSPDWQQLAAAGAQGAIGPQGAAGVQGPQGSIGPIGPMGFPGPAGPMPTGAAPVSTSNTFAASQAINGSLILGGAGSGVKFADGSLQTTAAISTSGGGTSCIASEFSSASPVVPVGYTALSAVNAGDVWFTMAPMPTPRNGMAAASLNGKVYAIGGSDNRNTVNTVEVYDPNSNSWSTATSMPTARSGLAAVAVNGKVYAIGGSDNRNTVNTVEVYDPNSNSWSTATSMPTAWSGLAAAALNGRIYGIGGEINFKSFLNTVEVYDPSSTSNSWSTAAGMPTARTFLAAADASGLIYAVGGRISGGAVANTTEQYSPPVTIYAFLKN